MLLDGNFRVVGRPRRSNDGLVSVYEFLLAFNGHNRNSRLVVTVHGKRKWLKCFIAELSVSFLNADGVDGASIVVGKDDILHDQHGIGINFETLAEVRIADDLFSYKRYDVDFGMLAKNMDGARIFNEGNECVFDMRSPLIVRDRDLIVHCGIPDRGKRLSVFMIMFGMEVAGKYLRSLNS